MTMPSKVKFEGDISHKQGWIKDRYDGIEFPVTGNSYTIREIVTTPAGVGYRLKELINPPILDTVNGLSEPVFHDIHFIIIE
jgi:hypothetical protein